MSLDELEVHLREKRFFVMQGSFMKGWKLSKNVILMSYNIRTSSAEDKKLRSLEKSFHFGIFSPFLPHTTYEGASEKETSMHDGYKYPQKLCRRSQTPA